MRWILGLALLAPLLASCAPPMTPGSNEACRVERVASVPLIPPDPPATSRWSIEVGLDGGTARMMLDSGATSLVISSAAAARLGLRQRPDLHATASGLGGMVYRRVFEVGSVTIGTQTRTDTTYAVEMTDAQEAGRGHDGIVGMGVFDRNDVEIDFPARTLTLYRARFCPNGAPPWPQPFRAFPRSRSSQHARSDLPMIAVTLDGHQAHALLDTGATSSVVDKGFARTLGVPDTPPPGARVGTARTMSETAMPMWRQRFDIAELAGMRFVAPSFWILDLGMSADMIVGLDVLAPMRIWISNGSDAVYIAGQAGATPGP